MINMKPIEVAWRVLKEDFDLRQTLESNTDPNSRMAQALAQARQQKPAPPLQLEKLPSMTRQTTLPPELTAGASVGKDFREAKFPQIS